MAGATTQYDSGTDVGRRGRGSGPEVTLRELLGRAAEQGGDALDVMGHRERVERAQAGEHPAACHEQADVAGQRGRVAGYVGEPGRAVFGRAKVLDDLAGQP